MTWINIFSVLVAILAAVAAGNGLYHPEVYSTTATGSLKLLGNQDFVILAIFVPLLLTSTWLAAQKQYRGILTWLGAVGFLGYVYTGYAFGGVSGKLFLLHIAIAAISFFILFANLAIIDAEEIRLRFTPVTSFGFTAIFLLAIAFLMEIIWLQKLIPTFPGLFLKDVTLSFNTSLQVQVIDLAFLGPLCFLAGFWLYFHKAVGYVFTGMLLVMIPAKFGTMINDFNLAQNYPNLVLALLALLAGILLICFLKKLKEEKLTSYHDRVSGSI